MRTWHLQIVSKPLLKVHRLFYKTESNKSILFTALPLNHLAPNYLASNIIQPRLISDDYIFRPAVLTG